MAVAWGNPQEIQWSTQSPVPTISVARLVRICVLALILALVLAFQFMPSDDTSDLSGGQQTVQPSRTSPNFRNPFRWAPPSARV